MPLRLSFLVAATAALLLVSSDLWAAPTAEQRAEILALGTLMTKAANLFTESKFKEAGDVVKEVQTRLGKLSDGADQPTMAQLTPIHKRLAVAHAKLELEGIKLPELKPLPEVKPAAAKAANAKTATTKTAPTKAAPAKTAPTKAGDKAATPSVSFVKDVAPILNARCGGCHVRNARGQFSMATFDSLMQGPMKRGKVIFPGDLKGSTLIEKVQEKEMPPSGAGIPDAELATLKKWVQDGAKFDGPNPAAQLTSYVTATNQPATAAPTVQKATGKETVSFAREIAPIFVKNCTGCHGTDQPRNDFSVNTITRLLQGGMSGEPVLPGKPAESLLVRKLKGTGPGARMPQRAPPLDEPTIAKIQKWIEEGARYDAPDATQPLVQVAAIAKAQSSTHEQLTKDRAELAAVNWQLGMPGKPPKKAESANFLVLGGGFGENTLAEIGKQAEVLAPKVGKIFNAPPDQPLVKGRVTLFVFGERYDYSEFGKMVEKRDLPSAWRGHYRFSVVDAYGAVLMPNTNEYDLEALIAQQLAAVYVASLGKEGAPVPHWFAEGCGRVVATRMAPPSDRRVSRWDEELSGAVGSLAKPDDFLAGKLAPENADVCSFSFAKFLMADRRFVNLMDALRKGGEFKRVFGETFGGSPEQLAAVWVRNPPKVGRLKGK